MNKPDRTLVIRNVAMLWVVCGALLAAANLMPAIGNPHWRSAAIGLLLLAMVWLVMRHLAPRFDWHGGPGKWGMAIDRRTLLRFAIGLAIGSAMIGMQLANIAIAGDVRVRLNPDFAYELLWPLTLSFLAWAAVEEIAFRSYPLFQMSRAFGFWRAQSIVALVFAGYHVVGGVPPVQALLGTGVGSLAFGAAALASRGLALPIGLHASWNVGEWLLGSKGERFPSPWRLDIGEASAANVQIAGTIGYFVLFAAVTLFFWQWHRRTDHRS